ncbi:hypothetical protein AADZ90_021900 [Aestuariibius sp. 2305UL40-4]|uniref:hypothetical protein n=1 Tax=Aestuariibius violaceus TaxID=3234132 RepID=UPI00398EA91D
MAEGGSTGIGVSAGVSFGRLGGKVGGTYIEGAGYERVPVDQLPQGTTVIASNPHSDVKQLLELPDGSVAHDHGDGTATVFSPSDSVYIDAGGTIETENKVRGLSASATVDIVQFNGAPSDYAGPFATHFVGAALIGVSVSYTPSAKSLLDWASLNVHLGPQFGYTLETAYYVPVNVSGEVEVIKNGDGSVTIKTTDESTGQTSRTQYILNDEGLLVPVVTTTGGFNYPADAVQTGNELNGLDLIAHDAYVRGERAVQPDSWHGRGSFGDGDDRNDNDWRRPEPDDDGPDGNERGVSHGSGGGANSTVGRGSGGNGTSENHSAGSPTGWDGRSDTDLDGPEAAGAGSGSRSGRNSEPRTDSKGRTEDDPNFTGPRPIVLDLDGTGIEITQLWKSTTFVDATGDGLLNRTAWAAAGDGVLFYDPDDLGEIVEQRQYVFTEWDPTATSDLGALRSVFDSNGDGVLDASDAAFADFKVMVTNADGSTTALTLADLGIVSIDLTGDATQIVLPDGSMITGQTEFTFADGSTGTVADMTLAVDPQGRRVEQVEGTDGSGNRTLETTAFHEDGSVAYTISSVFSPDGALVRHAYDDNGDGAVDRLQEITTVTQPNGTTVETVTNWAGADLATAVLINSTVTTRNADGSQVTTERDSMGGGWVNQEEIRIEHTDGSHTNTISDLGQDGTIIRSVSETISADGLTRITAFDEDGDGVADTTTTRTITINPDGSRIETTRVTNADGTERSSTEEVIGADSQSRRLDWDLDGDGDVDTSEDMAFTLNADGSSTSILTVRNGDGSVRNSVTTDQSDDTLQTTTASDLDGDGDADLTVVEETIVATDGARETDYHCHQYRWIDPGYGASRARCGSRHLRAVGRSQSGRGFPKHRSCALGLCRWRNARPHYRELDPQRRWQCRRPHPVRLERGRAEPAD